MAGLDACGRWAPSSRTRRSSFDDELLLKVYRRVEAGVNPELELLRFLTDRGFPRSPALDGWCRYLGTPLEATLGIAQDYVPGEGDGWELALEALAPATRRRVRRAACAGSAR